MMMMQLSWLVENRRHHEGGGKKKKKQSVFFFFFWVSLIVALYWSSNFGGVQGSFVHQRRESQWIWIYINWSCCGPSSMLNLRGKRMKENWDLNESLIMYFRTIAVKRESWFALYGEWWKAKELKWIPEIKNLRTNSIERGSAGVVMDQKGHYHFCFAFKQKLNHSLRFLFGRGEEK